MAQSAHTKPSRGKGNAMGGSSLTTLIKGLSIPHRIRVRRRVESLVNEWALRLVERHGKAGALIACRKHMVFCVDHAPGIRSHIWSRVGRVLRDAP